MSKKDNFGQAMYEMFGVGKDGAATPEKAETAEKSEPVKATVEQPKAVVVEKPAAPVAPAASAKVNKVTYLAEGTVMEGTLRTKSDVEICGEFKGEIVSEGKVTMHTSMDGNITAANLVIVSCKMKGDIAVSDTVTLDEATYVEGNITAANVNCAGKIKGDLDVRENLTLEESAQVNGNIQIGSMSIARGAKMTGNITMKN